MVEIQELDNSVITSPPSKEDEDPVEFKSSMILIGSVIVAYMYMIFFNKKKKKVIVRESERKEETRGKDFFSILTKSLLVSTIVSLFISIAMGKEYKYIDWFLLRFMLVCAYGTMISMMFDIYCHKPEFLIEIGSVFGVATLLSLGVNFFHEQVSYDPKTIKPPSSSSDDIEKEDDWSEEILNKEKRRKDARKYETNLEWIKWIADNFSDI
jgi:hypothetical protein